MRAAAKAITVQVINQAKGPAEVSDSTRGLYLRVGSSGAKSLWWRGTPRGSKKVRCKLLDWPADKGAQAGILAEARALAAAHNREAGQGIDPTAPTREERQAQARDALSVGAVAEAYFSFIKAKVAEGKRSEKFAGEVEATMRKRLAPLWGRAYLETGRRDLQPILDELAADKPRAAGALFEACKAMANAAAHFSRFEHVEDDFARHPWITMKGEFMVPEKISRDRVLTADEIRVVWAASEGLAYPYGDAVKMLLWTGCRLREVTEAQWGEFDLTKAEWTIPGSRNKTGRPFVVALPAAAVELLASLPRFAPKDGEPEFVFSTTAGKRPISGFTKFKARLDKAAKVTGWRLHDIRRSVRTNLSDLHVPEDTSEMVLNHKLKGLQGVYNRSDYVERRREALELWAGRLRDIVTPAPAIVAKLDQHRAAAHG